MHSPRNNVTTPWSPDRMHAHVSRGDREAVLKKQSHPILGLLRWPYYRQIGGRESWRQSNLVTVIRLLQALMLLMVISSLPNLITAWYSTLYCPSNHSDINENVIEYLIKHFMRAHELMLRNISIGNANAGENWLMASIKKRRVPSAFYRLGLLYLFLNFPNIKTSSGSVSHPWDGWANVG